MRIGQTGPSIVAMATWLALVAMLAVLTAAGPASAAWAGTNGPVVFAGGDARSGNGLWAMDLSRKGIRHLTLDPSDSEPQSSPNGRWIVFVREVEVPLPGGGGVFPARHIFRARSDGTGVAPVTDGPIFDRSPSFAPSGQRILFSRFEPGAEDADIFSISLDGTGLHQLTSGAGDDRNPVFSPNRRLIAFDRFERGGASRHVHTMRPDGSRIVDATPDLAAQSAQPDFNPAGNRIVFVRGFPGDRTADLFTMRPDGAKRRQLTGMRHRAEGGFSGPSYSPDGKLVVAQFGVSGGFSKLQVIRLSDRSWGATLGGRRIARSPDMRSPVWQARRR